MKPRFFSKFASAFLGALITLNLISVSAAALSNAPFEKEDSLRQKIVNSASGKTGRQISVNKHYMGNENRYIVVFKKNAPLTKIKKLLDGYYYRLLADSDERIFLVYVSKPDEFYESRKEFIDVFEKDTLKKNSAYYPNDTYSGAYELGLLGMTDAWGYTLGSESVIVAVIDSGIDRYHEDFSGTKILSGFDYETGQSNVSTDSSGHGTKVAGIIAATDNNGVGCVGIAPECTILPLKITNSDGKIYTSDFIDSLYVAADGGADVINMSLGGYEKLESEEKAIKYAVSKGCILVAASGNEGNDTEYAGQKCYPASYDGVISVGAVDENGKSCVFSQHNDAVDISAPGSGLSLLQSGGGYTYDSGTSFSSAYISGIAALAVSMLDAGYEMTSDQFDYLISSCAKGESDLRTGAGIVFPLGVLENVNFPLVSGVENGGVYYDNVFIFFNRGVATLDGEEFKSGDLCKHTGDHTLKITDGDRTTEIKFTTDNLPLSCSLKEGDGYSYFSFSYGTAYLNGHPYISGDPVKADGKYTLVLTGEHGNSKSFEYDLSFSKPQINGVENGEIYNTPVRIAVATGGKIYLNGKEVEKEFTVFEEGQHTLLIKQNGNLKTSVNFTVSYEGENNPYKFLTVETSLKNAKSISNGEFIAVWNDVNRGARIYESKSGKLLRYINVSESITAIHFEKDYLYIAGTNNVFEIKISDIRSNVSHSLLYQFKFPVSKAVFHGSNLYFVESSSINSGTVKKLSLDYLSETDVCFVRSVPDLISFDSETLSVAFGSKETGNIYVSPASGESLSVFSPFESIETGFIFQRGLIACGGKVFSVSEGKLTFSVNDKKALYFDGKTLITEKGIYDVENGEVLGYHAFELSSVGYSEGIYSAAYSDVSLFISRSLPSAKSPLPATSVGDAFGFTETTSVSKKLTSSVSVGELIYASGEENALFVLDSKTLQFKKRIYLPFTPTGIEALNNKIFVYSENVGALAVYYTDTEKLSLFKTPCGISNLSVCEKYFAFVGEGKLHLYETNGNKLYSDDSNEYISTTFSADGSRLYATNYKSFYTVLTSYLLPAMEKEYERILDYEAESLFCDNAYLYINTVAYLARNGNVAASCSSKIYGKISNAFICAKGLFADNKYISSYFAEGDAFIIKNSELFCFNGYSVFKLTNPHGSDISTPSAIWGVEDGGEYSHSVTVGFSKGMAYLDGKLIESGHTVADGGEHLLEIILPYGMVYSYTFRINASLSSIKIKGGDTAMKVNDTKTFQAEFLPKGSPTEAVMFYSDDDTISVAADGTVTAIKEGEARLYVATLDGRLYSSIKISVLSSMLIFTPSFLGTDRTNGILYGVSSGTVAEQLIGYLEPSLRENCKVFNGDEEETGIVKTGMKISLLNKKGEIQDSLLISVVGDCNGDGNVDVGDLYTACDLMAQENPDAIFVKSADFSNTGTIDVADIFTYKEIILGNDESVKNANTPKDEFGGDVTFCCESKENGTVAVKIYTKGNEVKGLSGKIFYDNEKFAFISSEKIGYINGAEDFEGNVSFFTVFRDEPQETDGRVLMAELTFLPISHSAGTFSARELIVFNGYTASVEDKTASSETQPENSVSNIVPSVGALIPSFSPNVFSYVLRLPAGTSSVDFSHVGGGEIVVLTDGEIRDGSVIKLLIDNVEYTFTVIIDGEKDHAQRYVILVLTIIILTLTVIIFVVFFFGKRIKKRNLPNKTEDSL